MAKNFLDLHGYLVEDVDNAVDRCLRNATGDRVRIMTGKGQGKVKSQVIKYLSMAKYQWAYEKLRNGQTNEGILVVFLD